MLSGVVAPPCGYGIKSNMTGRVDLHGCLWIGMDCVHHPVDTALKPV